MERKIKAPMQLGGPAVDAFEVPILESTERWSELTLEDGAVIRIKPMIVGVIRVEGQWDQDGNPVYALRGGPNLMSIVSVPDRLKKPVGRTTQGKAN
ncbi:MAG TPA: hypothetical protein VMR62_25810 [Bryobacteraceae bacterium]|nr:hypothetical protein [Bryobacteraceae bacterium]